MRHKSLLMIVLLCMAVQGAWAWDGSGTQTDPYLIKDNADWRQLARQVSNGYNFQGMFFEMTADIDAEGVSAGTNLFGFSGTFDGGGHTLTYDRGGLKPDYFEYVDDFCAPFIRLDGATIRHFKVKGGIFSRHMHAAGIASLIDGSQTTTIDDCHVSSRLFAESSLTGDASFAGLVGNVNPTCTASPVIKNCSFTGGLSGWANRSSGLVGYTNLPIAFEHCMMDPKETANFNECATFARMAPGVTCTFKECYYTQVMGAEQGEAVFREVLVSDGCKAEIISEPTIDFDGEKYWQNGAVVMLAAPDGADFNHWETNGTCYINDPWRRSGTQVIGDLSHTPSFSYINYLQKPSAEREMDGTKYRYLSRRDYHLYLSDEVCRQKYYHFDSNGDLFKWDADGNHVWVTAVVGWVPGDIPSDGAQIHNDLKGVGRDHTLTACIAPHAFQGCTELKTLYFKDTDANIHEASTKFDFIIGDSAFAVCPNLTEVKMMQYTTTGNNHWEALAPGQVSSIGQGVFDGSPNAYFSTDASEYQNYLSSTTWKDYQNRVIVYNHTNVDFTVNGAKYSYMRNTRGDALKNNSEGHADLMQTLRLWNADYQDFTASSLLTTRDDQNIWYTYIVGCDDSYLKSNDGTLRIYNDPGSYYNYKTLAIGRDAFKNSKELRKIEFYQTNGRSENSYTDLKMVIQNGAFQGCSNLKELRMFYYVQDGDDHWEVLGPKDVIPGDNIFGEPSSDDVIDSKVSAEELRARLVPEGFRILVSPELFDDFINDPNWSRYLAYLQPVDYSPAQMNDFTKDGLTYSYITSPGDIMQTSQTVSQDVSWWTAPRIGIEVLMWISQIKSIYNSVKAAFSAVSAAKGTLTSAQSTLSSASASLKTAQDALTDITTMTTDLNYAMRAGVKGSLTVKGSLMYVLDDLPVNNFLTSISKLTPKNYAKLVEMGLVKNNLWAATEELLEDLTAEQLNRACYLLKEGLARTSASQSAVIAAAKNAVTAATSAVEDATAGLALANTARTASILRGLGRVGAQATFTNTASVLSARCWGGKGSYNGDLLQKGMRENILSNIHQVGVVGGGYVITTPQKNLAYHTYIKDVPESTTDAVIYAGTGTGQGRNNNARTMTMAKRAFRDHKKLKTVKFYETDVQSDEAMPMLFTIPDSAFVGCTNLQSLDLRVQTRKNGMQAMGPENFILAGDSIFAGLDPAKFHIIIDPRRKQDFLDNESWNPLAKYFTYMEATPETQYQEYGGNYAYAYVNGTTQKVNKVNGHKIEHTVVTGADNGFLSGHQGALKLCNDIGVFDNYQLDAVTYKAFMGNQNLRVVNFTDLKGTGAYGDCYTGLQVALMDSCFADCKNLANLDLLYLVTDGDNHIEPIKPDQVSVGNGILDGTKAKIKMMPQQVAWFEADSTWSKYKDRFMPCIIKPGDNGIRKALKPMAYYDMAHTGYDPTLWDEYIDLARIGGAGFSWLDGKFGEQSDDILSFADFKYFESVGLDYVGKEWFRGCKNLSNIELPSTVKTIREFAFANCYKLEEIELPAGLQEIGDEAFNDCPVLKTIRVRGTTPAKLTGKSQFSHVDGLKIYVPAASVDDYKTAWAEYKDYIVSDANYKVNKVVTVTKTGELAEKLGLFVEMHYSGLVHGDEPLYVHGNYSKYDSLTVIGPLSNVDLAVIRYLAGCDAYTGGGKATDGRLRYLNLYNADIKKTNDGYHYYNDEHAMVGTRYDIKSDNKLPDYIFKGCTALETVVLPKSLAQMGACIFAGCTALKRVAITSSLTDYDDKMFLTGILDYPLEELVFVTDQLAVSGRSNPWGQPISVVFTKRSQLDDYMNQPYLTRSTRSIIALFQDDAVMETLARKGQFFPSEYLKKESIGTLFREDDRIKRFDDLNLFAKVKELEPGAFYSCRNLKSVSLPDSLERIARTAFSNCSRLDTIYISTDKVPELAEHAFADLPADFRIIVPKSLGKLYRETWTEYADHINVDESSYADNEWTVVTLDKPNTLAEKLGFEVKWDYRSFTVFSTKHNYINGVRGDYSNIHKLKVKGPISGSDFAFMRYLAGFCPWSNGRNMTGPLEAIDLYDADIKASDDLSAPDMFKVITHVGPNNVQQDNELPTYAFLQAYNLKSLVLPKTCTKINSRALQQCEALETLVLGDDLVDFDWSALDDDAMLTRLYIMARKKPEMTQDSWLVRQLYNNYNPTFDAFYVRPSLYDDYLNDRAYTHDLQRTNLISKGVFDDDDSFCSFARHAAATQDDLADVDDVRGWFDAYPGARNLTPLKYTSIDSLKTASIEKLTQLECIALPKTLKGVDENVFQNNTKMRYVDFLECQNADLMSYLRYGAQSHLGLNEERTLVYMPAVYDNVGETNVVVVKGDQLRTEKFHLVDSLDYLVPYAFGANSIENSRKLAVSKVPYTICLPYSLNLPAGAVAYKLSERNTNKLVFEEVADNVLEAFRPYLVVANGEQAEGNVDHIGLDSYKYGALQPVPASKGVRMEQDDVPGYSVRGTFKTIGNAEAADLGAYILQSDGNWHPVTTAQSQVSLKPFRVFLLPSARNAGARTIGMSLVDDDSNGIDTIETIGKDGTHRYYDLNGRELQDKPDKGIYLRQGKKYVNK